MKVQDQPDNLARLCLMRRAEECGSEVACLLSSLPCSGSGVSQWHSAFSLGQPVRFPGGRQGPGYLSESLSSTQSFTCCQAMTVSTFRSTDPPKSDAHLAITLQGESTHHFELCIFKKVKQGQVCSHFEIIILTST